MNGKKIVITPNEFDIFRRALGHLVNDLLNKPKEAHRGSSQKSKKERAEDE